MSGILYTIIIYPLELIIEFIFSFASSIIKHSVGASIICVSAGVTLLTLPLYAVAQKWQRIEKETQQKLKPQLKRIKQTFSGDERYMMTQAFYKESKYHPLMALRSSFSLLIMVPFFMAAYNFLSSLSVLQNTSFLFIHDMSTPDKALKIGSFYINVLPLAMTLINCIAGAIYAKGQGVKENLQIYVLAFVFLAILYNSPAGLVLYWTFNNIFSLLKNVFYKLKHPLKVFYFCIVVFVALIVSKVLFFHHGDLNRRFMAALCFCLPVFAPFFVLGAKWLLETKVFCLWQKENLKICTCGFLVCCVFLTLLLGLVIPAGLISSSVVEFFNVDGAGNPSVFVWQTFFQAVGLFLFWPFCIYLMFSKKIKALFFVLIAGLCFCAVINAFCFIGNYGTLTRMIMFSSGVTKQAPARVALDLVCCLLAFVFVIFMIATKKANILNLVFGLFCFSMLSMGLYYKTKISKDYKALVKNNANNWQKTTLSPIFHFSKTAPNVIFLMLDRANSAYFPLALKEDPQLAKSFSGFVYYPDTLSFNEHTLIAAPALYGGYEYTPEQINKRDSISLLEKNNEALTLLPRIFSEQAGFLSSACDSSWAGYSWIPNMHIFDNFPKIKRYLLQGKYTSLWLEQNPEKVEPFVVSKTIKRNLLYFSFFRSCPLALHDALYDDGLWWSCNENTGDMQEFLNFYSVLDFLPQLTDFDTKEAVQAKGTYLSLTNESTHKSVFLQATDYQPAIKVQDLSENQKDFGGAFCTFMAAIKRVATWLDFLKENDCYNNTKIIIAADHGIGENDSDIGLKSLPFDYKRDHLHPLLLFKDFLATGDIRQDDTFMTTADVPVLATKDILDAPINPYTKKPLKDSVQKSSILVTTNKSWSPGQHKKKHF